MSDLPWIAAADAWWSEEHDLDSAEGIHSLYALVEKVRAEAIEACAKEVGQMPLCTVRCAQRCAEYLREGMATESSFAAKRPEEEHDLAAESSGKGDRDV